MAIGIAGLLGLGAQQLGTTTFGRVVKFTKADPVNIAARAAVRERGLALLRELHKRQGEDKYDRVIIGRVSSSCRKVTLANPRSSAEDRVARHALGSSVGLTFSSAAAS
jgi:hypothetical protein